MILLLSCGLAVAQPEPATPIDPPQPSDEAATEPSQVPPLQAAPEPPTEPVAPAPHSHPNNHTHPELEAREPAAPPSAPEAAAPAWILPAPSQSSRTMGQLMFGAVAALFAAIAARRTRMGLRPGVLHTSLGGAVVVARALVAGTVLALLVQLLPAPLVPVVPWAILGAGLAIGWSLRDALPDVIAWFQLMGEGSIRPGLWLLTENAAGRVEQVGMRATRLTDAHGRRVTVPNHLLIHTIVATSAAHHFVSEVRLSLPSIAPNHAREALGRAALLSPWVANEPNVVITADGSAADGWCVRAQLLDGAYADAFEGSLRERVLDLLEP